jgi:hypothetical protein
VKDKCQGVFAWHAAVGIEISSNTILTCFRGSIPVCVCVCVCVCVLYLYIDDVEEVANLPPKAQALGEDTEKEFHHKARLRRNTL